jgi:prepilin-type N-terminal cleavage/methylation domain-containing protein
MAAGAVRVRLPCPVARHPSPLTGRACRVGLERRRAFTLVEMLVVMAILGIIAGLAMPALKNFGRTDAMTAATAQMVADVARARQLAISQRTTVYMVFLPANFWKNPFYNTPAWYNYWWSNLSPAQRTTVTNLCDRQLTGYTFMAYGAVGDQPGNHLWHYLASWQSLPEGTFIATNKFDFPGSLVSSAPPSAVAPVFNQWDKDYPHSDRNAIYAFTNVAVPFPTEGAPLLSLPCLAFNYLGQLTTQTLTPQPLQQDEYIPLVRGNVMPAIDSNTRAYLVTNAPPGSPQVFEVPPGNSTNAYNIIHIDWLTGRATLEQPRMQ